MERSSSILFSMLDRWFSSAEAVCSPLQESVVRWERQRFFYRREVTVEPYLASSLSTCQPGSVRTCQGRLRNKGQLIPLPNPCHLQECPPCDAGRKNAKESIPSLVPEPISAFAPHRVATTVGCPKLRSCPLLHSLCSCLDPRFAPAVSRPPLCHCPLPPPCARLGGSFPVGELSPHWFLPRLAPSLPATGPSPPPASIALAGFCAGHCILRPSLIRKGLDSTFFRRHSRCV
ncbi:hypothetical protein VTN49DRAFT_3752 [Thermomyces lanuginosus]|uniref:uncharacterized protein n=1 Tax=Thermomyces lanuginosus TaxID=5541 RepID=UPI003742E1AD